MLKQKPERLTYAQKRLITLIEERKLRRWCLDNSVTHSAAYRLAVGEQLPTYRIIASMCHLIAPIEWLFFTDEKPPYEPMLLPQWTCEKPSKFVSAHRFDYKTIAERYGLEELSAYNIFVAYRANPTPAFIRAACDEADPADFFTDGTAETKSLKEYVPERGDIVSVDGKIVLALTRARAGSERKIFTGCAVVAECDGGIALHDTKTKGLVNPCSIHSFPVALTSPRTMIERAGDDVTEQVLEVVRENLR